MNALLTELGRFEFEDHERLLKTSALEVYTNGSTYLGEYLQAYLSDETRVGTLNWGKKKEQAMKPNFDKGIWY